MIKFEAEIKSISATKTVSNDREIKIVLLTNSPEVLSLQNKIAEETITVIVE